MIEYLTGLLKRTYKGVYDFLWNGDNPTDRRLARLAELQESGQLEGMCSSQVDALFEKMFGVRGEFPDNDPV